MGGKRPPNGRKEVPNAGTPTKHSQEILESLPPQGSVIPCPGNQEEHDSMTKAYRMVGSEAMRVLLAYKKYPRGILSYSQETQLFLKEMVFVFKIRCCLDL